MKSAFTEDLIKLQTQSIVLIGSAISLNRGNVLT